MAKANIGLSMLHCLGKPFPSLLRRLRETTLNHVELIDDGWHSLNQTRVRKLKEIGEAKGLAYTLHAPFASINIAAPTEDARRFVFKRLKKSLTFAKELNCRLMLFHPGSRTGISGFYPGMDWKKNIESVRRLLAMSRDHGVRIAVENVPEPYGFLVKNVEQFSQFFHELGEELGMVLDVGHSNINNETHSFLETFGSRIIHVHAHDNDGVHDLHLGIGYGTVNWPQFVEDIKKIRFKGVIMVESYYNVKESVARIRQLLT